jgi:hypothetical protein
MKKILQKKLILPSLMLFMASMAFAQDFLPALNDNYMGINQVTLQPAALVDSRFKVDVNVGGFNNDIYNAI